MTVSSTHPAPAPDAAAVLPGLRGLDHVGFTVPDLTQAVAFFRDVLGCALVYTLGPLASDDAWMARHLALPPGSRLQGLAFMRCGNGSNFELFEYDSPGQRPQPRNSDIGGHHLAFYVDDCEQAAAWLRARGVQVLDEVKRSGAGPSAGQTWVYFLTPWGMQCELVSFPQGKAYERSQRLHAWNAADFPPSSPGETKT